MLGSEFDNYVLQFWCPGSLSWFSTCAGLGSVLLRSCGQIWRIKGSFLIGIWSFWVPKAYFLDFIWQSGVLSGSSVKIKRKWDPIPQKNLTFLGSFFEAFFDYFLEGSFRDICWPSWRPKAPKGPSMGHFWESFWVKFWARQEKWELSSRLGESSVFEVPGAPKLMHFLNIFLMLYQDLPQRHLKSFLKGFMSILGAIWDPFGGHFGFIF